MKPGTDQSATDFSTDELSRILFKEFGLSDKTKFVVAYSGGCDSQVLLHGLACLRTQSNIEIVAAHFDHGLQEQSGAWAKRCQQWCEESGIRIVTVREEINPVPGESVEAVARSARYRWLGEIADPDQVVVTAHHADDQAETFLLHLFQGKEIDLLAGIAPSRPLLHGSQTVLIRPLLGFTRAQLTRYANANRLQWIVDPSNENPGFYRNFIRQELMPILMNRWPDSVAAMNRGVAASRRIAERDRAKSRKLYSLCSSPKVKGVFCLADPLDLKLLHDCEEFEFTGLIRHWIHQAGYSSPSKGQLATLYYQTMVVQAPRASLEFNGLAVRMFNRFLYLTKAVQFRKPATIVWDLCPMDIPELNISMKLTGNICANEFLHKFHGKSICLAWRKGGERIRLDNRKHSTSLKKVFQSNRVPPWERDCLPFITINGEISWVHGIGNVGETTSESEFPQIGLQFSRIYD